MSKSLHFTSIILCFVMLLSVGLIPASAINNQQSSDTQIASTPAKAKVKIGNVEIKTSRLVVSRYSNSTSCALYLNLESNEMISDIHFTSLSFRNPNNNKIYYNCPKGTNGYVHFHLQTPTKKGARIYLGKITIPKNVKLVKICPENTSLYVMSAGWKSVLSLPYSTYLT